MFDLPLHACLCNPPLAVIIVEHGYSSAILIGKEGSLSGPALANIMRVPQ